MHMREIKLWSCLAVLGLAAGCEGPETVGSSSGALDVVDGQGHPEPPMLGAHVPRGAAAAVMRSTSPAMTWHGGAIMNSAAVTAIFWGARWGDAAFAADKTS